MFKSKKIIIFYLCFLILMMSFTSAQAQTEEQAFPNFVNPIESEEAEERSITDQELLEQLKKEAEEDQTQEEVLLTDDNQEDKDIGEVLGVQYPPMSAVISADSQALVNTEIFLNAGASYMPPTAFNVSYSWDLGDGAIKQGKEITHIYKNIGEYKVSFMAASNLGSVEDKFKIQVRKEAVFLIVSEDIKQKVLDNLRSKLSKYDFLIYVLPTEETGQRFIVEDNLANNLLERSLDIRRSKVIISWTKGMTGVNALLRLGQQTQGLGDFSSKGLIVITDSGLSIGAKRAQPLYNILQPQYLLLASPDLSSQITDGIVTDHVISNVQQSGKDFRLLGIHSRRDLGKLTFYNFMSYFINALINRGISINTVFLVLMLPLVATFFAAARQIIGVKTFGIYIPSILTLTFLTVGIKVGLVILIVILLIGTLIRLGLKKLRLLYLPRVAIVYTAVSLAILVLMGVSLNFNILNLISVSIFPVLILIALVEEFVKVQMEEGSRNAVILTLETLILAIFCYYFVNWQFMRNLVLSYPEIIFGTILLNLALGKWTGLRVMEYYRFRKVINLISKEKESKKEKVEKAEKKEE